MENASDPEWAPFMKGQAAYARAVLDAIPGRRKIAERVAQLSADAATTRRVQAVNGRIFYEKRPQGADNFKLYVRQGLDGAERTLVDAVPHRAGDHLAIERIEYQIALGLNQFVVGNPHRIEHAVGVVQQRAEISNPSDARVKARRRLTGLEPRKTQDALF